MSVHQNNLHSFPSLPRSASAAATRPLRVCIASCEFVGPIRNGGIGTAYTAMARALVAAGHKVTLLYTNGQKCENETIAHWQNFYRQNGLRFVARPSDEILRIDAPAHALRSYETYRWLKSQDFDLVHFPEWGGDAYYSLVAKHQGIAFANTRFCIGTHSPTAWLKEANSEFFSQPSELEMDFMERQSVALADFVVSPCQYMLHWMRDHGFQLPAKSFVQQNILPASACNSSAVSDTASLVTELVFFGRLETRKGIELFCDALDRLTSVPGLANVTITFLGKPATVNGRDSRTHIANRAEKWPWRWSIVSDLDQPGAMRYLRQLGRLAVVPSLIENSPYTVLECIGGKIPFLAARVGGIPELIAPGEVELATFNPTANELAELIKKTVTSGARAWQPAVASDANEAEWLAWHTQLVEPTEISKTAAPTATPLVSVCVAHFNRPQMLAQALASLEAQDYPNFEVIVVDDGSNSAEAIAFLQNVEPRLHARGWRLVRQHNQYLSAARNTGARQACGEFVMFMDDDNYAKPEEISTFVRVALHTRADVVTACMEYFEGTGPPAPAGKPVTRWVPLGADPAAGFFRNVFGDANCLVKKSVFAELGGFTEIYGVTHEDWEFLAKAVLKGFRLEVIPEALFHYRYTPGSMIRSTSQYRNHQRHIRPFLELVPPALHQVLQMAQGAWIDQTRGRGANVGFSLVALKWRSQFEAGLMLAKLGHAKPAKESFLAALSSAETSNNPVLILDALLEIGRALRALDADRARQLLKLACVLGEKMKSAEAVRHAKTALAEMASPAKKIALVASNTITSIIIPVFNNLALTRVCLDSLARFPTEITHEIIVVDNASTDGTSEYLQAQKNIRVISNVHNEGFARACNQGAQAARGSLLLFLNNDTQVTSGWLTALARAAEAQNAGVVGAKLLYTNGTIQHAGIEFIKGVPDHPHRHAPVDFPAANQQREFDMVTGACLLTPTELFLKLGGFDEAYRNGVEDVDYCLRIRAIGRKVIYEPQAVVYHHEGQSVGRFSHVNENLKIFFGRWGKSFDQNKQFIVPAEPKWIPASQSVLLAAQSASKQPVATKNVTVSWEGSFLDHGSLSHVNRALVGALKDFPEAQIHCVANGAAMATDAAALWPQFARALTKSPASAALTVRHAWPPNWQRPRQGKLVVIQPWEFGALPEAWVQQARAVDEFWLPSEYVRRVYIESGVPAEKAFVVPNGVDTKTFNPQATPRKLATQKTFKFLFVGGTIGRKGPDLLLQAYLNNFTAADDVCLVIKDFGGQSVYAGQTFEAQIRAAQARPNAPEILYLNEELPPSQLPGLYTACDCFVLPYRGEGFGLPALEAMACGLPLIVTAGGATDDFVRDEFAWRIPAERKIFGHEVSGLKLAKPGWLLEPKLAALGERMRHAFENPAEARQRGQLASQHAQQNWSWQSAAAIAAQRIKALTAPSVKATAPAPIPLPAVARLGQLTEARELFAAKNYPAAWQAAQIAIGQRPFHPAACLLLAEIAVAAGDGRSAKVCAEHARHLAPGWEPAKKFLKSVARDSAAPKSNLPWLNTASFTPHAQHLTICLITKNEEKFLTQCLKSVRALNAQLIVVDTGSTDRTVEIAREFGAEVYSFTWCDDFSAARNAALEHATGDWVLMLDADEELPADQHAKLLADMERAEMVALRLPLVNVGQETEGRSFVPRLFRNAPEVFFHGRIHEQVFASLLVHAKNWGLKTDLGTAQILHHGYTKELVRDRNKVERNLQLLRLGVAENPADANLMMNFGMELVRSGDLTGGLEKYRDAFHLLAAQPPGEAPEVREALLSQFTSQLYKVRGHAEVVQVLTSPLAKQTGLTASLHLALGLSLFELKNYSGAAEQMRACLVKKDQPALTPVNLDIFTAAPLHCLALCSVRTGQLADAEKYFTQAVQVQSRANEARVDFAKFLAEQNRAPEALQQLHAAITADANCQLAWQLGGQLALSQPQFLEFALDWTGEAMRHLASDPMLQAQRAEALLLAGQPTEAAELWRAVWEEAATPRSLAALILCTLANGQLTIAPRAGAEEEQTSRAFVAWYQRLLQFSGLETLQLVHNNVPALTTSLPTAAQLLLAAMAEAQDEVMCTN